VNVHVKYIVSWQYQPPPPYRVVSPADGEIARPRCDDMLRPNSQAL
jgi:hypothetical protein